LKKPFETERNPLTSSRGEADVNPTPAKQNLTQTQEGREKKEKKKSSLSRRFISMGGGKKILLLIC